MYANCRNVRVLKEIGVEKHDGDVRFKSGNGIWPFRASAMHPAIITVTVRSFGYGAHSTFHRTYF